MVDVVVVTFIIALLANVALIISGFAQSGKVFTSGKMTIPHVGKNPHVRSVVMSVGPIPVIACNVKQYNQSE